MTRKRFPTPGKRAAAAIAVGLVAAIAVAGCSNSRSGQAGSVASCDLGAYTKANIDWKQQSGKTIEIAVEEHPWWQTIKPQLACFEQLTGITVKPRVLGEDQYISKVATELSAGSATPDIFMVNQYGQAQGSGWLEPLDPFLNNSKLTDPGWYNVDDFFEGARSFAQTHGQYMAMPITAEAQMLFVRSDLVPTAPKTIDELKQAATAAKTGGVGGFGSRAVASANQTPWPFGGFAFSSGGEYLDASGKPHLDSEANVEALNQYSDLIKNAGLPGASSWGFLENEQAMQQGKLAIWTDSSTFLGALKDPSKSKNANDINAYPFPAGASGRSLPNAWYWTAGINSKSQQKEASWLFLEWATSEPISEAGAANGASPARAEAWDSAAASQAIGKDNAERVKAAIAGVDSSFLADAWKSTSWNEIADPLARAVNSAVTGSDPASALKDAQQAAQKVVK